VIFPAALLAAQRSGEMPLLVTEPTGPPVVAAPVEPLSPPQAARARPTATARATAVSLGSENMGIDLLRTSALQR